MFNSKQTNLLSKIDESTTSEISPFLEAGLKIGAEIFSENGALKYNTTGSEFIDQFGSLSIYRDPRTYESVAEDMSKLWSVNPRQTVEFALFIRMITRKVNVLGGIKTKEVQRGAGLKHEGIMRFMWLHVNHPDVFWKNIGLFISSGSWKDIFTMLSYDLQYNGWKNRVLNWDNFAQLIISGLSNPEVSELIKKYLPSIKSNFSCKTLESQADNIIAKWICSELYGTKDESNSGTKYKQYRLLKSSGTAHEWQKLISQGKHKLINFDKVPGKALSLMVSGKYLENQNLEEDYSNWISDKPLAKFNGHVPELFSILESNPNLKGYQEKTINAQFNNLVETAKSNINLDSSLIVVRDTSCSMLGVSAGIKNMTAFSVAKSLALFFSEMLPEGMFSNSWIEFNSTAELHKWTGSNAIEKYRNDKSSYVGSTNFQSVIDLFIRIKNEGVSEKEFPKGMICISDMEFDGGMDTTNFEEAKRKLLYAGFSADYVDNFKFIFWIISNNYYSGKKSMKPKFETFGDVENVYYISGYDGSIISFLSGGEIPASKEPKSAKELFESAMSQELMAMVEL